MCIRDRMNSQPMKAGNRLEGKTESGSNP